MMLSITLATYNVAPYLRKCLDSILNQTFIDFELICLDDGSTDDTVIILKEYAAKDYRFRLILKDKNEGLAVARNTCLVEAKGKYVTFVDGDDFFDLTLFEKAVEIAERDSSDIVMWDYLAFYDENEIAQLKSIPSDLLQINTEDKTALFKRPAFTGIKLLKTDTVKELKIYFPPGYTRQDIPVHWHLLTQIHKNSILPERLYYYRQQPDATTAKKDGKLFHLVHIMDIVEKYLKDHALYDTYREPFLEQRLNFFAGMYDNIKPELKGEALRLIQERMTPEIKTFLKNKNNLRPYTRYFLKSLEGSLKGKIELKVWKTTRSIYRMIKK